MIKKILMVLLAAGVLSCSSWREGEHPRAATTAHAPSAHPFRSVPGLPEIQTPPGFDWRQFSGVELEFISENTPPSSAISANLRDFEQATGIKVNIQQMDLVTLAQKIGLDFAAGTGRFHVIYADPLLVLPKFASKFVDLNTLRNDPALPSVPGGLEDFIPSQLEIDGYMGGRERLYTLPYDSPTMVLVYRTDVFKRIAAPFKAQLGYDPTPGPEMTWERYLEVARYINAHAAELGVKYGTGHQAKQYDSLMCDFTNVLAAYGGSYFEKPGLGGLGASDPGPSAVTAPAALSAFEFYQKLLSIAHPGSRSWDWNGLAEAFAAGEIAMAPEWHEFASMFENPEKSKVAGKVGWSILPRGPQRSANLFGGTGIGINVNAGEREKKAAWLFLVWATSPQTQLMVLESAVGGATPSRRSVYQLSDIQKAMEDPTSPQAKKMPNLTSMKATLQAWKPENIYARPKLPQWPQIDTVVYTELSKMLAGQSSRSTAESIRRQVDALSSRP